MIYRYYQTRIGADSSLLFIMSLMASYLGFAGELLNIERD